MNKILIILVDYFTIEELEKQTQMIHQFFSSDSINSDIDIILFPQENSFFNDLFLLTKKIIVRHNIEKNECMICSFIIFKYEDTNILNNQIHDLLVKIDYGDNFYIWCGYIPSLYNMIIQYKKQEDFNRFLSLYPFVYSLINDYDYECNEIDDTKILIKIYNKLKTYPHAIKIMTKFLNYFNNTLISICSIGSIGDDIPPLKIPISLGMITAS
jgi:tetratricopeptide (TPR) repeat protein